MANHPRDVGSLRGFRSGTNGYRHCQSNDQYQQ